MPQSVKASAIIKSCLLNRCLHGSGLLRTLPPPAVGFDENKRVARTALRDPFEEIDGTGLQDDIPTTSLSRHPERLCCHIEVDNLCAIEFAIARAGQIGTSDEVSKALIGTALDKKLSLSWRVAHLSGAGDVLERFYVAPCVVVRDVVLFVLPRVVQEGFYHRKNSVG